MRKFSSRGVFSCAIANPGTFIKALSSATRKEGIPNTVCGYLGQRLTSNQYLPDILQSEVTDLGSLILLLKRSASRYRLPPRIEHFSEYFLLWISCVIMTLRLCYGIWTATAELCDLPMPVVFAERTCLVSETRSGVKYLKTCGRSRLETRCLFVSVSVTKIASITWFPWKNGCGDFHGNLHTCYLSQGFPQRKVSLFFFGVNKLFGFLCRNRQWHC